MWTRTAPWGALLLAASALHAEPRGPVVTENWYASLASEPIDIAELRNDIRLLVGIGTNGLLLNETRLPDVAEIDEFDLSDSARDWLAARRASARRPIDRAHDRYALLWYEEPAGSTTFEMSDRTLRRSSRNIIDDVELSDEGVSLERLVASESLSTTNDIRSLVLAD